MLPNLRLLPALELRAQDLDAFRRLGDLEMVAWLGAAAALLLAGLFAALGSALGQAVSSRILARLEHARRDTLKTLLDKAQPLRVSANMFETASNLTFALIVLLILGEERPITWSELALALCISVPVLWFTTRALAQTVALRFGDRLVISFLPTFHLLQLPLAWLVWLFEALRRGLVRLIGLESDPAAQREIVAGLREVIAEAEISGGLDATEREIIGNVMEFRDVDVAAVMTPRTRVVALEVGEGLLAAASLAAEHGHSRLPVYQGTLDTIVGIVSARELLAAFAARDKDNESVSLRSLLHPVYFVPETKKISTLLAEFRKEKIKLAVVLDEYGGTAGLVTLTDVLAEIVGELKDQDDDPTQPLRILSTGLAEIDAGVHVSEVNEALELDLPEQSDFETLGGFVLAELGRFPNRGERFVRNGVEYTVLDANDRRVLKLRVKKSPAPAS